MAMFIKGCKSGQEVAVSAKNHVIAGIHGKAAGISLNVVLLNVFHHVTALQTDAVVRTVRTAEACRAVSFEIELGCLGKGLNGSLTGKIRDVVDVVGGLLQEQSAGQ